MATTADIAEHLASLPAGSQIIATWTDNSQQPVTVTRTNELHGGATSGSFMLAGTAQWLQIASWGADITVTYDSTTTTSSV